MKIQVNGLRGAQKLIHAALAAVLTVAPAATPALRQAAIVAGSAAAAGVWAIAHTPALDSILGAPTSAHAYDPNLPPGAVQADYCYGLNDNGAMVHVLNRFTGTTAYTSTVTGLQGGTNEASSFDASDAKFYILDQATRPDRLVEVSLSAGGATAVTEVGTGGLLTVTNPFMLAFGVEDVGNEGSGDNRVTGITLDPYTGKMYGVTNLNYLFQIDKTNGKVVLGAMIGSTDFVTVPIRTLDSNIEIEDLAFDPTTGRLYVVYERPRDAEPGSGYIHEIDPNSGALIGTELGPIGRAGAGSPGKPGPGGQAETEGLTFGGDGILYVSLGDASSVDVNDGRLLAIQQPINSASVQAGEIITRMAFAKDLYTVGGSSNYDYESVSCNAAATIALAISKTHTPPNNLVLGQQVVFSLAITNTGVYTANTQVVDNVPAEIGVTSWSCSISDPSLACTPSSGSTNNIAVTGYIPPLNGTMNLLITGVVQILSGVITNTAQVTETSNIPEDRSNNVATDTVKVATPGVIGNYVWLDENGDGQQDAGEAGIANVTVQLVNAAGATVTTTTDANGGYLFKGLAAGTYTVSVQSASLPTGLIQTVHPVNAGLDFGNQTQPYVVTLAAGQENLTADFGYDYAPSPDTDLPGAGVTGAIGDRVWIDANGNGRQDPGEPGIGGVTVNLLVDTNQDGTFGGAGDAAPVVAVTQPDGTYIFDGLPAGAYVVRIPTPPASYTQTGDPDHFGTTGTLNDNKTTTPIVLGPGDVFVNADFGYQPPAPSDFDIGDTVFVDTNGNGTLDGSDYGIAGVTVALLNSAGKVIATTQTDATGKYLFTGLPNGTYTVWVNDTDSVLGLMAQTSTPNNAANNGQPCGTCNGKNTVTLAGADNLNQDFGYAPLNHSVVDGLIGDTIFLDRDNSGTPGPDEGIEGVQVVLAYANGVTATTVTDENGHYYFGDLPAGTYTVTVNTSTLPPNVTNSVDPDGGNNSTSTVVLPAGGVNLLQDFGYVPNAQISPAGNIGNLIWKDVNADGVKDASETGIDGVTIDLYEDVNGDGKVGPGDRLIGSTVTAAGGAYNFANLPTSSSGVKYVVDVTDDAGLLGGNWHSLGAPDTNDNSQVDPYAVTLTTAAPNYDRADFGYYVDPASVGNFVWKDVNGNGVQDAGESGLDGVKVTLVITYPNGDVSRVTTLSGDDPTTVAVEQGWYRFGNLLLDEDYRVSSGTAITAPGQPAYVISVATPAGYVPSPTGNGTPMTDSNAGAGTPATATQGQNSVPQNANPADESNPYASYDFGFFVPASIGDTVFFDANGNGAQDGSDLPLIGVVLTLTGDINNDGIVDTITTTTNFTGYYQFTNLPAGQYTVTVVTSSLPPEVKPSYDKDGGAVSPDGVTPVTLNAGDSIQDVDFGYTGKLSLGDYVWNDRNADGVQDASELPIPGVVLTLTGDLNNDNIPDTLTTTTNVGGGYYFVNLPAGVFTVTVNTATLPPGLNNPTYDLDSGTVSPDNRATVTLSEVPNFNVDFGYRGAGAIGDYVWLDANGDGVQDASETPLSGVLLTLQGDLNGNGTLDTLTTTTSVTGYYQFSYLPAGTFTVTVDGTTLPAGVAPTNGPQSVGSNQSVVNLATGESRQTVDFGYRGTGAIGDYVWLDVDGDGVQDASETPLSGVLLTLQGDVNADGAVDTLTTTTSVTGYYQFSYLPAGVFTVTVDSTTLPAGVAPTSGPQSVGSNQSVVTLAPNESRQTVDFGYRGAGAIGDYVWNDHDGDGVQDASEPPLPGVVLTLNGDVNADGVVDTITTTTSVTGYYQFDGLPAGVFTVTVDATTLPPNMNPTSGPQSVGSNQSVVNLGPAESRQTVDFGYRGSGAIGDYVWNDANNNGIQDASELPLPGVVLTLRGDVNGDSVVDTITTTTSITGYYQFSDLPAGVFTVTVDATTLPPNMAPTSGPQSVGSNQSVVNLGPIESRQTVDFGYRQLVPKLVLTKSGVTNGLATIGSLITYTLRLTNTGEAAAVDVKLTEIVPTGTVFESASGGVTPDANRVLTWTISTLPVNGNYVATMIVRVTSVSQSIVNVARVGSTTLPPTNSNEVVIPVQPTAVMLASFNAVPGARGVRVTWQTSLERNTLGFNVWRSATGNRADAVQVNAEFIEAKGGSALNEYSIDDAGGSVNSSYWLEEIELDGTRNQHGPVVAQAMLVGVTQPQPAAQPAANAGVMSVVGGGVPVAVPQAAQPVVQPIVQPVVQAQPVAQAPAFVPAAPAVIAAEAQAQPAVAAQPATEAQPAAEQARQADSVPVAQPVQPAQPALPPAEQVVVGAESSVSVARGGQPAAAQLPASSTQSTTTTEVAETAQPLNPLIPLGAGLLALLGIGAAGVFVVRRRRNG